MHNVVIEPLNPYLVLVVLKPTQKQVFDEGTAPQIIVQPQAVLAKDENQAAAKAMRMVPEEHVAHVDRLEVAVMSFRRAAA